jgi:hypothetical protein
MPESKKYGGINRDELNRLRGDLKREGVTLPEGDSVKLSGIYGVELQADYDEAKETLKISITKKPFYIPESEVWKFIDAGTEHYVG